MPTSRLELWHDRSLLGCHRGIVTVDEVGANPKIIIQPRLSHTVAGPPAINTSAPDIMTHPQWAEMRWWPSPASRSDSAAVISSAYHGTWRRGPDNVQRGLGTLSSRLDAHSARAWSSVVRSELCVAFRANRVSLASIGTDNLA